MEGYSVMSACIVVGFLVFGTTNTNANIHTHSIDTSSGFCETHTNGKIPIGESDYDDAKCERVTCNEGELAMEWCGPVDNDMSNCDVTKGTGRYPSCCPGIECN